MNEGAERAVNKWCKAIEESNMGTLEKEMIVQALRNYWLCIKLRNI